MSKTLGPFSRTLRGAGLSSILRATVYVLLHCCFVVVQLLTGEVVQLKEPAGLYHYIGAGVTRNSILGNGLEEKTQERSFTVKKGNRRIFATTLKKEKGSDIY